jgi:hypothetical protein
LYKPTMCGLGDVYFPGGQNQRLAYMNEIGDDAITITWDASQPGNFDENILERQPVDPAEFAPLAVMASRPETYKAWTREFADFLFRTAGINTYRSPEFKIVSNPGESESDFRIRISQLAREKRDRTMESLRNKYGPKTAALEERIRRAEQRVEKEKADVRQAGVQTAISLGATLLGAFMGRKTFSTGTIGRASTTMRSGMRTVKERSDIAAASENLSALQQQRADLEADFNAEMVPLRGSIDPMGQVVETIAQRPKKTDISVRLVALVWAPYWKTPEGVLRPAFV